jgi:uncharacterized protein (DUF58 family)
VDTGAGTKVVEPLMKRIKSFRTVLKLLLVVVLVAVTFSYAMFQGGFVSWFLFYTFMPFAIYSLLLAIYPLKDFQIDRTTNQDQFVVGDRLIATVTLERKIPFPLGFLIVEELLPDTLQACKQSKPAKVILFPWFKRNFSFEYQFEKMPRGEHCFKAIRIKTGDFLGLIEKEYIFRLEQKFLVYPHYVDIAFRQLEQRFDQGSLSSRLRMQKDTSIAIGIRDYKPGDRFSWIDWKASARRNDLMSKEFEQQQSQDVVIFLDRSSAKAFEEKVTLTASLVRAVLKHGAQVGFVSAGKERVVFPLRTGEAHQQSIFYHLATVQPESRESFAAIIDEEIRKWQYSTSFIMVLSDINMNVVDILKQLSFRNIHVTVFIVKEKMEPISRLESAALEKLKGHNLYAKIVYENNFSEVFFEVNAG